MTTSYLENGGIDTEAFWNYVLEMREPAWHTPTREHVEQLTGALQHIAERHCEQIWARATEVAQMSPLSQDRLRAETADRALAMLRVLQEIRKATDRLATRAAEQAGNQGANYPQIAAAYGTTRQAARQQWPGIVHPKS